MDEELSLHSNESVQWTSTNNKSATFRQQTDADYPRLQHFMWPVLYT